MAAPGNVPWLGYLFEATFEQGTFGEWGTKVDGDARLTVQHYAALVRRGIKEIPYRGAYALLLDLSIPGINDAYVQPELLSVSPGDTIYIRWYCYIEGLVMGPGDTMSLLQLLSGDLTTEAMLGVRNVNNVLQWYAGETQAAGAGSRGTDLIQGQYHLLELATRVDTGPANDGIITLFVDGYQVGLPLTGIDQARIIQLRLGAINRTPGTTAGRILMDQFVVSSSRIGGFPERFPTTVILTKSGHVALGEGRYEDYVLESGGDTDDRSLGDNYLNLYDTDEANTLSDNARIGPALANLAAQATPYWISAKRDGTFRRGMYVELVGTNPRAYVTLGRALISVGLIQSYALQRSPHGPF